MACIMGIDAGNYETKICVGDAIYNFPSDIGEYRERKLIESFGRDDIIWEYKGKRGFGGSLARFESEYGGTIKGKSKVHSEAILRILIAIHKYGKEVNKIVIGQPIDYHLKEEKDKLKSLLKGPHELVVNEVKKQIIIEEVEIAPEGSAAILSHPLEGLVRIIDIGSGTTNFATLNNLRRIDKGSFTEQIGTEIMRSKDPELMANGIYKIASATWDKYDNIYLTGGGANQIYPYIKDNFPNCKILKPRLNNSLVSTKYANAIGFYEIAKGLYNHG